MKLNSNFQIRNIAGEKVIIPTGEQTVKFNGLITGNPIAMLILEKIEEFDTIEELIKYIANEYDEDINIVSNDIHSFIIELRKFGIIE